MSCPFMLFLHLSRESLWVYMVIYSYTDLYSYEYNLKPWLEMGGGLSPGS